jgi:deazaflavin-dependent oxidoreductase (nitroreductase family)
LNKTFLHMASAANVWIYRLSGGRFTGRFPSGAPVCLFTTTGRRSGQRRTVPLLYLQDGEDLVIVASQGGAPQHPGWFLNIQSEPRAEVEVGRSRFAVIARTVDEDEKSRLWPRLVSLYPPYEAYQRRTSRRIPVVRLSPVGTA